MIARLPIRCGFAENRPTENGPVYRNQEAKSEPAAFPPKPQSRTNGKLFVSVDDNNTISVSIFRKIRRQTPLPVPQNGFKNRPDQVLRQRVQKRRFSRPVRSDDLTDATALFKPPYQTNQRIFRKIRREKIGNVRYETRGERVFRIQTDFRLFISHFSFLIFSCSCSTPIRAAHAVSGAPGGNVKTAYSVRGSDCARFFIDDGAWYNSCSADWIPVYSNCTRAYRFLPLRSTRIVSLAKSATVSFVSTSLTGLLLT